MEITITKHFWRFLFLEIFGDFWRLKKTGSKKRLFFVFFVSKSLYIKMSVATKPANALNVSSEALNTIALAASIGLSNLQNEPTRLATEVIIKTNIYYYLYRLIMYVT
jgi:hypothetical protein